MVYKILDLVHMVHWLAQHNDELQLAIINKVQWHVALYQ